jgi:hypothetical protein
VRVRRVSHPGGNSPVSAARKDWPAGRRRRNLVPLEPAACRVLRVRSGTNGFSEAGGGRARTGKAGWAPLMEECRRQDGNLHQWPTVKTQRSSRVGADVANAVFNATGVRDFPITLDKVLTSLPRRSFESEYTTLRVYQAQARGLIYLCAWTRTPS